MGAAGDGLDALAWLLVVAGGIAGAIVVHELGHVLAAGALGGEGFRLTRVWPVVRVEASLPPGDGPEAAFLAAGALANLGGAAALAGAGALFAIPALLQVLMALLALVPIGTSDGARLRHLWRGRRAQGETGE